MAKKNKKPPKELKPKAIWLENKIVWARSLSKHQAARAAARFGAPAGVALLLLLTLYSTFAQNSFQKARNQVLKNPDDVSAHLDLAEEFLKNNQLEETKKELDTISQLVKEDSRVLASSLHFEEVKKHWRDQDPEEIRKEVEKWEKFLAETPTYRDGWFYLALYYFKLGDQEKAEEALEKAKDLNPLNPTTQDLEKLIKNE